MMYNKQNPLRVVTLCSGYDSQCLALERLKQNYPDFDYELVAWSEFDPQSTKPLEEQPAVVAHNALFSQWADRNLGDMTKIDWTKVPDFDLLTYSTPCFVAGTLVLTDKGYKPIEEVQVGDMVLTHTNSFNKVLRIGHKPADKIVKVRAMMFDSIYCTPNHKFYTRELYRYGHKWLRGFKEPTWKEASELTKKDYLGLAVNSKQEIPTWNGTIRHFGGRDTYSNKLSAMLDKPEFWTLMGIYVGDGWTRDDDKHKGVMFASTDAKRGLIVDCLTKLGFNYTETKENTCGRITVMCKELCEFARRYGKYAHGKRIDEETLNLPMELLTAFLIGYIASDGCFTNGEYRISTTSKELAYGLMQIIAKCLHRPSRLYYFVRPSTCVIEGRTVNQRDTYTVCWHNEDRKQDKAFYEDGIVWYPIKDVVETDKQEFVYNLEVENDNSYTANGAIVHNCQSISQAGLQHGFTEGSGTRSSIIWHVRDALRIKKPKYALLENVAAMVSQKFLPMFNLWRSEVYKLGYDNFAQLMNSKNYGVPQNRERIFMLSIYNPEHTSTYHFPEPFELKTKLKDMLEDDTDTKYYLNPNKVNQFVKDNMAMIEKYVKESDEEINPLPDHLRKWLDEYPTEEYEETTNTEDEEPVDRQQEIGFDDF